MLKLVHSLGQLVSLYLPVNSSIEFVLDDNYLSYWHLYVWYIYFNFVKKKRAMVVHVKWFVIRDFVSSGVHFWLIERAGQILMKKSAAISWTQYFQMSPATSFKCVGRWLAARSLPALVMLYDFIRSLLLTFYINCCEC